MEKPSGLNKSCLLERLESCKLIFRGNSKLLDKDRLLNEQVLHKLMMIESQMYEISIWERVGDQAKYYGSLEEANRILATLTELIKEMCCDNDFLPDGNLQQLN